MDNKKNVSGLAFSAVLVEALITYTNQFFVQECFSWKMLTSIFLGVLVAVAYKIDLPEYFDMTSKIPYIGCVITGILISRGSNYLFDLLAKITGS